VSKTTEMYFAIALMSVGSSIVAHSIGFGFWLAVGIYLTIFGSVITAKVIR
jgi:hypothetical protein